MLKVGNYTIKALNFIPALLIYIAIYFISVSFTYHFYYQEENYFIKYFLSFGFYSCLIMTVINHLLVMFSNPGKVEKSKFQKYSEKETIEYKEHEKKESYFDYLCSKCQIIRPERSYHCKTCNICVLRYEKHCTWMFNCIGLNNLKYYYLFLLYCILSLSFAAIGFIYKVLHYELIPKEECNDGTYLLKSIKTFKFYGFSFNNEVLVILMQVYCNIWDAIYMSILIILCILLILPAICEFECQTELLLKNKTTIESIFQDNTQKTPYLYNDKLNNIKLVLGNSFYIWFLPIAKSNNDFYFPITNIEISQEVKLNDDGGSKSEGLDKILKKNK